MNISALIIEDHPIYRDALLLFMRHLLGAAQVAAVTSTEEALAQSASHAGLRLILLDLRLPGMNGVEAICSLRKHYPDAAIVVVSASEDRREVDAALRAGAKAFISKAVSTDLMIEVVRKILANEVLDTNWITLRGKQANKEEPLLALTPRQQETLTLLCQGLSNKEIGLRLDLAEITVKMHVTSIFRVLNVVNRTQAVLAARSLGLYTPDQN
ncbi:response regulator transcription factor [Undibacterium sp. TS12]|uniref:response regulator n=1 Tax=Undibacterium sp. TS12 TaxID=2908202 RepID=UPI001F4D042C|nr:response regulator transcription factor [Undibacterium sp. TS12]MCH8621392.1 response regulator transcription factor [Undibacterium sp. TS12]